MTDIKEELGKHGVKVGGEVTNTGKIEVNGEELPQTPQKTKEELFNEEYQALCKKYGMQVVARPVFEPTNHGTYEFRIILALGLVSKELPQ